MQLIIPAWPIGSVVPQRQAEHRAQVVLELARSRRLRWSSGRSCGRAAPSRWRPAVHPTLEQLDRQHADIAEVIEQAGRVSLGQPLQPRAARPGPACGGGCPRGARSRPAGRSASRRRVPRTARIETSRSKRTKPSRISGRRRARPRRASTSARRLSDDLALAVVAEPPGLQHRRQAELAHRGLEFRARARPRANGGGRDAELREQGLLEQPVLRDRERVRAAARPARVDATRSSAATGTFSNS